MLIERRLRANLLPFIVRNMRSAGVAAGAVLTVQYMISGRERLLY